MGSSKRQWVTALVALALLAGTAAAGARTLRCSQCGTVIDVDAIRYDRDVSKGDVPVGTIIGGNIGSLADTRYGGAAARGFVGRNADRANRRGGERGRRIELRMDRGRHRVVEVHGEFRVFRGDRVRVLADRVVLIE